MQNVGLALVGYQLSLIPDVEVVCLENAQKSDAPHTPEHSSQTPRRYSRKGEGSGSIAMRIGNRRRANPSTSYFYEWYDQGDRCRLYIRAGKLCRVKEMIEQRAKVDEILAYLTGTG